MAQVMMDARFMLNKSPITGALAKLKKVETAEFTTMAAADSRRVYGIVGQTMKELPRAVSVDGLGYHYVDTAALVPVLVAAVQELAGRVAKLETAARKSKKGEVATDAEEAVAPMTTE